MVRTLIIDDEAPARDLIRHYLKDFKEIEIIGECENGFEGFKLIQLESPDLIFLDVKMPKITGFEMLELVENPPLTIFSTAYDEYAIRAFELNAIDYLMKPYSRERFEIAVKKALDKLEKKENRKPDYQSVSNATKTQDLNKIIVKNGNRIQIIPLEKIKFIEAQDDYVSIVSDEGRFLKQTTMKSLEDQLPEEEFVRIHRSYILRIDQLKKLEAYTKDTHLATILSEEKLPVSKSGYQKLKGILNL